MRVAGNLHQVTGSGTEGARVITEIPLLGYVPEVHDIAGKVLRLDTEPCLVCCLLVWEAWPGCQYLKAQQDSVTSKTDIGALGSPQEGM